MTRVPGPAGVDARDQPVCDSTRYLDTHGYRMTKPACTETRGITQAADVPLLVVSCDAYSDLWKPFFELFRRRWPDCPFRVYLGTNEKDFDDDRVTVFRVGPDQGWSANLRCMLDRLETDYVILFLEDFFLLHRVDTARVLELVQLGLDRGVGCLRLYSILPPPHPLHDLADLGGFEPGDPYRVTLQAGLWRVETLRRLLRPGLTPWQFELIGSQISETFAEPFWGVYHPPIVYDHVIEKGRWKPSGLTLCAEADIPIDTTTRPAFTEAEWRRYNRINRVQARLVTLRNDTVRAFMAGRRKAGLGLAVSYLSRCPWSLGMIAVAMFGLVGPRPLRALRRAHVAAKLLTLRWRSAFSRPNRRPSAPETFGLTAPSGRDG